MSAPVSCARKPEHFSYFVRRLDLVMKIYPKHNLPEGQNGFSAEEIRRGEHWLYADVKCQDCGKIQSLAMAGSIDNGKCIKCGGKTV